MLLPGSCLLDLQVLQLPALPVSRGFLSAQKLLLWKLLLHQASAMHPGPNSQCSAVPPYVLRPFGNKHPQCSDTLEGTFQPCPKGNTGESSASAAPQWYLAI